MRHLTCLALLALCVAACQNNTGTTAEASKTPEASTKLEGEALVQRGRYLTTIGGCNDCHTPKKMTEKGPALDESRLLSGHPAGSQLPAINAAAYQPGQWVNMSADVTAFVGPWGVSYAANLTPDSTTGMGAWSKDNFVKAMRTGKHMGIESGRPILPPMPWEGVAQMTDEDLEAVYVFLRSIPAIANRVPEPTPPAQAAQPAAIKNQ